MKNPFNLSVKKSPCVADTDWHGLRGKNITASIAGALWGVHDYATPYKLYHLLQGTFKPDDISDQAQIIRGNHVEKYNAPPLIAESELSQADKDSVIHNDGDNRHFYHSLEHRIGATPDFIGDGFVIQIKSVQPRDFREKWENGDVIPDWITLQTTIEAYLVAIEGGYDLSKYRAYVMPIVFSHGIDAPLLEIKLDPKLFEIFLRLAGVFWNDTIANGKEPDPDFEKDADTIGAVHGKHTGNMIDFGNDIAMIDLLTECNQTRDAKTFFEKQFEALKARLKFEIGFNDLAYIDGHKVAYGTDKNGVRILRIPKIDTESIIPFVQYQTGDYVAPKYK